jgi:hypothetical protein
MKASHWMMRLVAARCTRPVDHPTSRHRHADTTTPST